MVLFSGCDSEEIILPWMSQRNMSRRCRNSF